MTNTSRRRFLAATGSGLAVALAGCLGGGTANLDEFDAADRPALGDNDTPVRMAVFEDFACPGCRQFKLQLFPTIVEDYVETGDVQLFHADFPLPVDSTWSYAVPSAAWAVFEEAGNDAFWSFSSAIYQQQDSYSYDTIEEVADEVADVGEQAREAAEAETYRDDLEDSYDMGEEWGVQGTPTVFVDDESVDLDLDSISEAIESSR